MAWCSRAVMAVQVGKNVVARQTLSLGRKKVCGMLLPEE
jgi:hypothetical protein